MKKKNWLATALLCYMCPMGLHRFYTGYKGIGCLQLLTVGGCLIWWLIDLFAISLGKFEDVDGNELEDYNRIVGFIIILIVSISIYRGLTFGHMLINEYNHAKKGDTKPSPLTNKFSKRARNNKIPNDKKIISVKNITMGDTTCTITVYKNKKWDSSCNGSLTNAQKSELKNIVDNFIVK